MEDPTSPAWLEAVRTLTDELLSHLDDYTVHADGLATVRWQGRTLLLHVSPTVTEVGE